MKPVIEKKLSQFLEHHEELSILLSSSDVMKNPARFRDLSKEYAQMEEVVVLFKRYREISDSQKETELLLQDSDISIKAMAEEELKKMNQELERLETDLQQAMIPKDPDDSKNIFLEIRAGTGGDEAAIFVGDLFRMYVKYAEKQKWRVEMVSQSISEMGGYKEIIARIMGQNVYAKLRFESGVHRVQRVPETEAQGRIHTSTCTVAVLPEIEEVDQVTINPADLRIDTYRASGAGGQHVNRTDSAVRIVHIPSGLVVECQSERSQHQNRARAMSLLQSRLLTIEKEKQRKEQEQTRRNQIGTGDRSERIRTYNYPQRRITDHRINFSSYQLPEVMEGELDSFVGALLQEHHANLLAAEDVSVTNGAGGKEMNDATKPW